MLILNNLPSSDISGHRRRHTNELNQYQGPTSNHPANTSRQLLSHTQSKDLLCRMADKGVPPQTRILNSGGIYRTGNGKRHYLLRNGLGGPDTRMKTL